MSWGMSEKQVCALMDHDVSAVGLRHRPGGLDRLLTVTCDTLHDHGVLACGPGLFLVCKTGVHAATCETKLDHGILDFISQAPCTWQSSVPLGDDFWACFRIQ